MNKITKEEYEKALKENIQFQNSINYHTEELNKCIDKICLLKRMIDCDRKIIEENNKKIKEGKKEIEELLISNDVHQNTMDFDTNNIFRYLDEIREIRNAIILANRMIDKNKREIIEKYEKE